MKTANDSNVHSVFHRLASLSQRVYQKHVIAVSSQLLNATCEEYAASGSCFHQAIFITKSSVIHIILVTLHTTEAHMVGIMNECLVILRRSLASCDQNHDGRRYAVCVFRGSWRFYCFAQSILYIDVLVQDCSNSIANTLKLPQYFTKPSMCRVHIPTWYVHRHTLWHSVPLHNLLFVLMQLSLHFSLRNWD